MTQRWSISLVLKIFQYRYDENSITLHWALQNVQRSTKTSEVPWSRLSKNIIVYILDEILDNILLMLKHKLGELDNLSLKCLFNDKTWIFYHLMTRKSTAHESWPRRQFALSINSMNFQAKNCLWFAGLFSVYPIMRYPCEIIERVRPSLSWSGVRALLDVYIPQSYSKDLHRTLLRHIEGYDLSIHTSFDFLSICIFVWYL